MRRRVVAAFVAVVLGAVGVESALAQAKPDGPVLDFNPMTDPNVQKSMREIELKFAYDLAAKAAAHGPADITLSDQAVLKLPAGYVFVPQKEGAVIMGALGNPVATTFIGLITSETATDNWFITVDFNKAGYLRDAGADSWDVDQLLSWLKDGAEASNEANAKDGTPAIEVKGWAETPRYDRSAHRLIWAAIADEKDAAPEADPIINYRTYTLGREGYLFLNLVANRKALADDKRHIESMLQAVTFNEGKRYPDFVEGKDRVAEFGLSALIASPSQGSGLLGASLGFLGKSGKLLILVAVGLLIIIVWRGRSSRTT